METSQRVEFYCSWYVKPACLRSGLACFNIDTDYLAVKPPWSVKPPIRTPIHAVQTASRTKVISDGSCWRSARRIDLEEPRTKEALRNKKTIVVGEGNGVNARAQLSGRNQRAVVEKTGDLPRQNACPEKITARIKRNVIRPEYALIGTVFRHDFFGLRINHRDRRTNH